MSHLAIKCDGAALEDDDVHSTSSGQLVKTGTVSLNLRRDSDQRTSAYGQESIRWSLVSG
ncbi:unnamed protein product [Brassica rapa subsp. narinosa]